MKTEEVIDTKELVMNKDMEKKIYFLVNLRCLYNNSGKPGYVSVIDDIITSLKRGEKFEQMWEENKKRLKDFRLAKTRKWTWSEEEIRLLEEKYFPKEE